MEVLDAAFEILVERGEPGMTMSAIAERAGASKETLYAWFDRREGLISAMIAHQADATVGRVERALIDVDDPRATLTEFAERLLRLLTDPRSLALNRAAMSNPTLADQLLTSGRHRVGPIVERYLDRLGGDGVLEIDDAGNAFETFYGLAIRDSQIRALLGEAIDIDRIAADRAHEAVSSFFALFGSTDRGDPIRSA